MKKIIYFCYSDKYLKSNQMKQDQKGLITFLIITLLLLSEAMLSGQQVTISGKVTDKDDGISLPGVSILVKGTVFGTTTDFEGNYNLSVDQSATLVFSYVGYSAQEIPVAGRTVINVQLSMEVEKLNEVMVVGYGTQRKRELTGSITKITGEDLVQIPIPSFEAGLQGKATGVQIIQSNGMAGSGSAIRIRGIGSISAGGDPLIVVDGMPITQDQQANIGIRRGANTSPLSTINPNDIESIDILKDASAAAIYGSRGANGVVLITTKRGKTKRPTFDFSYRTGIVTETKRLDLLNNKEWLQLYQEAYENDAIYGTGTLDEGSRPVLPGGVTWEEAESTNTDWQDLMLQKGVSQEVNLSFRRGGDKLNSYVGGSYSDQSSFLVGNSYERLSGRINLDYTPFKRFHVGTTSMFTRGVNNRVDASWSGGLGHAQSEALPIWPVKLDDGSYFTAGSNPVRSRDNKVIRTVELRSLFNAFATYQIMEGLNLRVDGGLDYLDQDENYYENEELRSPTFGESRNTFVLAWNSKAVATYDFKIGNANTFQVLAGIELNKTHRNGNRYWYNGIEKPPYKYGKELPDSTITNDWGKQVFSAEQFSFASYFARMQYNYKGKYLFSGSIRVDGSSRFGKNNKYGTFPAGSLGWIVTEEDFLKENKYLSFLKLKTSYGVTGNAEIPNYTQWGTTSNYDNGILYNEDPILYQTNLENPNVSWETSTSYDVGLEFGLFNDRIYGEFAYYNKQTKDMLLQVRTSTSSGWGSVWRNIGAMENKGFEFSFKSRNLVTEFKWTTDFNIGFNKNTVTDVGTAPPDALAGTGDTRVVEGHPIGVNYLVRFSHVDPEDGMPVFFTKDGELTKTYTPDDRVVVGKPYPDFIGGITNTFSFRNFDLSFLFNFSYGNDIYDDAGKRLVGRVNGWNQSRAVLDRWREPGDITDIPRLTLDGSKSGIETDRNTDEFLYDGSFIRLRNLTFGYNFRKELANRLKLQAARIYFVGANLLTFTNYPGGDPEIFRDMENVQQKNLSPGVTYLTPPQAKTYSIGIEITF